MKIYTSGFLTFIALFLLLLFGHYIAPGRQAKKQPGKSIVITFEKKPCFGFCPVYTADFMKNGEVKITYTKPFQAPQITIIRLDKNTVEELRNRGEKLGFFQMKDRYETLITDFQVRELTLYDKKKNPKTVSYTEGASEEFELYLRDLAQLVERNLNVSFEPGKQE